MDATSLRRPKAARPARGRAKASTGHRARRIPPYASPLSGAELRAHFTGIDTSDPATRSVPGRTPPASVADVLGVGSDSDHDSKVETPGVEAAGRGRFPALPPGMPDASAAQSTAASRNAMPVRTLTRPLSPPLGTQCGSVRPLTSGTPAQRPTPVMTLITARDSNPRRARPRPTRQLSPKSFP